MNAYNLLPICNEALKPGSGFVRDLDMSAEDIRSLELQGYIKNAVSCKGDTWKLTKRGEEVRNFFLDKRSRKNRISDWMLRNILRMEVRI